MTRVSTSNRTGRPRQRTLSVVAAALLVWTAALTGCGSGIDGSETAVDVDGSSSDETAPTSTDLIAAALAAGDIDKPTSLLYRTWTLFGDRSLPEQYRGAPEPHDLGLTVELEETVDEMPEEVAEQVRPYLLRPSDPSSAFSAVEAQGFRSSPGAVRQADGDNQQCTDGWSTQDAGDLPFRVWVCDNLGQPAAGDALDAVLDALSTYAPDMIADAPQGMGAPIPDDPGADPTQQTDDRIDVYVLPTGWFAPYRDGNARQMEENASGIAMSASPRDGITSSGYVLLKAGLVDFPLDLASVMVHELFHILQYSHNQALIGGSGGWLFDATASWAEGYFVSGDSGSVNNRVRAMQASELSLHTDSYFHQYWASLWPLFMEQQVGPESVFATWEALGSAPGDGDGSTVIDAINSQIDVSDTFAEFAMRLFNADLPGDPISPRFAEADPRIPDGRMPDMVPATLGPDPAQVSFADVPGLGYRFAQVDVEVPSGSTTAVQVTGTLTSGAGTDATVEALIPSAGGDYRRQKVDLVGTGDELCAAAGPVYLVMSNPSTTIDDRIAGSVTLELDPSVTDCGDAGPTSSTSQPSTSTTATPTTATSTTATSTTATPTTSSSVTEVASLGSPQFCSAWEALDTQAGAFWIQQVRTDPTTDEVAAMFAAVDPFLDALPGAVRGEIEHFRTTLTEAAGKTPAEAMNLIGTHQMTNSGFAIAGVNELYCGAEAPGGTDEQMASVEFCDVWATFAVDSGRYWMQMWMNNHPTYPAAEVAEVFDPIETLLPDLPDGAPEQVEVLRTAALAAADQPSGPAGDVLFTPEVKQAGTSVMSTHRMYCAG